MKRWPKAPWRATVPLVLVAVFETSCRARRGPAVPEPDDFTGVLVLAVIFLSLAWLVLKIIRG